MDAVSVPAARIDDNDGGGAAMAVENSVGIAIDKDRIDYYSSSLLNIKVKVHQARLWDSNHDAAGAGADIGDAPDELEGGCRAAVMDDTALGSTVGLRQLLSDWPWCCCGCNHTAMAMARVQCVSPNRDSAGERRRFFKSDRT